jgi:glutathione peroxidase-family protein
MNDFSEEEKERLFRLLESIERSNSEIAFWLAFAYGTQFEQAYNCAFQDDEEKQVFEAIDGNRTIRDIADVTSHGKMIVQTRIKWLSEKGFIEKNATGRYYPSIDKTEIANRFCSVEKNEIV